MKRLLLAILLLLLLAAAAVPPLVGERAAEQYQGLILDLEGQGLQVVDSSYHRGWLVSEAETVLQPAGAAWRLIVSSRIEHGPFPWSDLSHGRLRPAAGHSTTHLSVEPEGGKPQPLPILLESRMDLQGDTRVLLRSQDVSAQDSDHNLVVQGLEGELQIDRSRRMEGELRLALLTLLEEDRALLWLRELESTAAGERRASGLNLGHSRLTLAEGRFAPAELDQPLRIQGLNAQVRSGVDGEMVWVDALYRAQELEAGGERFRNPELKLRSDRLSAPVLARIERDLRALRTSGNAAGMDAFNRMAAVMANLAKLLEEDPELTLERLYLETSDGALEGRLHLTLSGLRPMDMLNPQRWLQALDSDGELAVPEALLRRLLTTRIRQELEDDPALEDSVAQGQWVEDEAQQRIDRLVRQELFQRRDGRLYAAMRLSSGLLTINGQSIPLPALPQ